MGLFGYNEKDYNRNTEIFKVQLQGVYDNLLKRGVDNFEVGNAIVAIINTLDWFEFPKGQDGKKQKSVDEYIASLITKISVSAQQRNTAKLVLQAKMLSEMILDGRSLGSLPRSPEDLKAHEILNDCLGELNQIGEEKEKLKQRKTDILKECKRLDSVGASHQIAPLKNEYMMLESKEKTIARKENELSKTYQYNCDALANADDREFYRDLGQGNFIAMSPQNVGKMVKEISVAIEKNNQAVKAGIDILDEFDKDYKASAGSNSSHSSFEADFENMKAGDTMNDVNGASYNPGASSDTSSDAFDQAFKNFQG